MAFACVTGLVLTGCGDDGDDTGDAAASSEESGGAQDQGPLAEYMGEGMNFSGGGMAVAAFSMGDMSEEDAQRMRQVEEQVAQCMQEQGFEYVPVDPTADSGGSDPFSDAYSLPPDEFAREYGYGISTLMMAPDAGGEDDGGTAADPNQEIRDGLSEGAREQYDQALWGDMAGMADGGMASTQVVPEDGEASGGTGEGGEPGCQQQASDDVFGGDAAMEMPDFSEFEGLFSDLQALQERIDNDARVVAATEEWADCIAAAGHSGYTNPTEPQQAVMERMTQLQGGPGGGAGDVDSESVDGGTGGAVDEQAMQELQDFEIALATADHDCQQEQYADVRQEVANDMEQQFVDEHRAELERYRDTMADGPNGTAGGVG